MDERLGHPARDPHGDPIPAADGRVIRPTAIPLADAPAGPPVRVERISDADPDLLQFFAERGIGVGTVVEARAGAPYSDAIDVVVGDDTFALGRAAAASVWVSIDLI
jgi:DtxR family Mn-dependent transcriptional regulator